MRYPAGLSDIAVAMATLLALGLVLALADRLMRRGWLTDQGSRAGVHALAALYAAATPWLYSGPWPAIGIGLLAAVAVGAALATGRLPAIHRARTASVGTVTLPLALAVATALAGLRAPPHPEAVLVAFAILAVCDPLAAWAGRRAQRPHRLEAERDDGKTWEGSVVFFLSAWLVATAGVALLAGDALSGPAAALATGGVLAMVAAVAEGGGTGGWDNLFIVVVVVVVWLALAATPAAWPQLALLLAGTMAGAWLAHRARILSVTGAAAAGLFAAMLLWMGGPAWLWLAVAFLVPSSLLSRVGRGRKAEAAQRVEKGSRRDAGQVFANGGVAWTMLAAYALWPSDAFVWAFSASLAAASADTWATELGGLSRRTPRMITTWQPVPPGTSGGVTAAGTLASVAGAVWIGELAVVLGLLPPAGLLAVAAGGVAGALVDSLAGAWWQALYRRPGDGEPTERPVEGGVALPRIRGVRWVTNDVVNLVCTAAGALAGALGWAIA